MCRSKNAGVAGYAEAFRPVQSDSQTSEWYSYFENDVLGTGRQLCFYIIMENIREKEKGMELNIAVIPGDGIGPEITAAAMVVLETAAKTYGHTLHLQYVKACSRAIEEFGEPLPEKSLKICKEADAVLLGNTGLEKYKNDPLEKRPEYALLKLRKELGVTTNIRPVHLYTELESLSPLNKEALSEGLDYLFVRDIAGGVLCSEQVKGTGVNGPEAYEYEYYNQKIVENTTHFAFQLAKERRKKVVSLDKANVLGSSRLWRKTVTKIGEEYPEVELTHEYIDSAALKLIRMPWYYDVILTSNLFGDIISDEGTGLTGTTSLYGSAELSSFGKGLYTPNQLHYPDESMIGQQKVSPIGMIMAVSLMFRCTFKLKKEAEAIERAVQKVIRQKLVTEDIYYKGAVKVSTEKIGYNVALEIEKGYNQVRK